MQSLAIKYRPTEFNDLVEQSSSKAILENQIKTKTFKQAYLFVGPAGCGKTTTARIFANKINNNLGVPVEVDAASHGNVDDIRELSAQAKLKPLDCEYKVFIIDECHCLSSAGWSAMLKLIEEPPATAVFIFCTTDVQKVPKTIMSRCQRFDFQRISQQGIVNQLELVCECEEQDYVDIYREKYFSWDKDALEYIAKQADGGMRDALTYLDKCVAYTKNLTVKNVVNALGVTDYDVMFKITSELQYLDTPSVIMEIEDLYDSGKDLKLFIRQYIQFLLDVYKILIGCSWEYVKLPKTEEFIYEIKNTDVYLVFDLIESLVKLQADIKYSSTPKYDLEATLLLLLENRKK